MLTSAYASSLHFDPKLYNQFPLSPTGFDSRFPYGHLLFLFLVNASRHLLSVFQLS